MESRLDILIDAAGLEGVRDVFDRFVSSLDTEEREGSVDERGNGDSAEGALAGGPEVVFVVRDAVSGSPGEVHLPLTLAISSISARILLVSNKICHRISSH